MVDPRPPPPLSKNADLKRGHAVVEYLRVFLLVKKFALLLQGYLKEPNV